MADNVSITPGSGDTVAADQVVDATLGTVKVQYVKIMDGTLDGTSKATVGATGLQVDTELPAAATLTDNFVTPVAPAVGAFLMVSDGTTWDKAISSIGDSANPVGMLNVIPMMFNGATSDRIRGTIANGVTVDVTRVQGTVAVTESGTWTVQPGNTANTTPWLVERRATTIQTYTASTIALASAAAATDIFTVTGSATKTIKIKQLTITSTATAAGNNLIVLLKRSTANTVGTSTAPTRVPHDSANAAATATVLAYTANPTPGTLVGNVRVFRHAQEVAATGTVDRYYEEFGQENQPIVLRGIAEVFAVNLNGATIAGGSFNISVVWTEE